MKSPGCLLDRASVAGGFQARLDCERVTSGARPNFIRWAREWEMAAGRSNPATTTAFFETLIRNPVITEWQFRQAVDAVRILARDVLYLPWAGAFDWQTLSDQARALGSQYRTSVRVPGTRCELPPPAAGRRWKS